MVPTSVFPSKLMASNENNRVNKIRIASPQGLALVESGYIKTGNEVSANDSVKEMSLECVPQNNGFLLIFIFFYCLTYTKYELSVLY